MGSVVSSENEGPPPAEMCRCGHLIHNHGDTGRCPWETCSCETAIDAHRSKHLVAESPRNTGWFYRCLGCGASSGKFSTDEQAIQVGLEEHGLCPADAETAGCDHDFGPWLPGETEYFGSEIHVCTKCGITCVHSGTGRVAQESEPEAPEEEPHICKPGATLYYCPTAGEVESDCHGGFDVCCSAPEKHVQIEPAPPRRPPYVVAYEIGDGRLYEVALPGDAVATVEDGVLKVSHAAGVAHIVQVKSMGTEQ